ncbi:cytochrome P450 [Actinokineospora bangkokensis]|uniref:cytochrome P450 n=1 Tax=Actinokineospora bangkokensis TaxID=1193682 RepID=UPI000AF12C4E|nr:cytochrome P450 [Actinokineospora bangkokensis]
MERDRAYAVAFAHEVRRFYPFAPFLGGLASRDAEFHGVRIPEGTMVILDLYGHNHDPEIFPEPYSFDPTRFLDRHIGAYELIPQGAGDPRTGHRCPGEDVVVAVLSAIAQKLAAARYEVPEQDLEIPLDRIPTTPRSRFTLVAGEAASSVPDQRVATR